MRYTIYRGNDVVVQNIHPEGTVTTKIMGEETAALSFTLPFDITFKLEDRIEIYGKNFFLADTPTIDKKSSREYVYTMSFLSLKYTLRDIQLMFYDENNELTMPPTPFMGTAESALDMVMLNIARLQPGWTKGIVDETEVKNVEFTECNCLEALSKIAETFELEFWVDDDKSIHFTERKPVSGYSFEYGKGKGLKNINRKPLEGASIVTRLYVKGSEKNLPKNYRNGQQYLRMDVPYLEKNKEIYGTKEHTETFDIYPKYEGTVTAVDADPHRFTDADIDFDLNAYDEYGTTVLMSGVTVKVIFQTGQLAGYTLELLEAGGFNYNTKTFYLQTNKDEKDMEVPSELLRPAVGDKYILVDLMMPAQYVTNAEAELKTKGQEYLDQNCKDRFQYSMGSDRMYFKAQNVNLVLGSTVHFKDPAFALDDDIRVTSLSVDIQDPYEVKFDLNESSAVSSIVKSYYEQQSQQNTIINTVKYNAELARRNYLFAREFHDNVFDGEGYFDMENIKPLSIETKMLSLGSRMQQFALPGVDFKLANNNAMMNTAGKLSHQTIDPNGIRDWNIAANSVIGISNNFNYIYIKAQRVGTNANFVVTEAQIKVEQDPDFYYFEVGYLSSVIDGYRKIKTTYGFAQLNPAELSIGRISDPTGNNYIDLLQDKIAIKAKVEFTADSPAIQQVTDQVIIGARNLLQGTRSFSDWSSKGATLDPANNYNGLTPSKVTAAWQFHYQNFNFVEGETYTLTAWVKSAKPIEVACYFFTGDAVNPQTTTGGWTRYAYTFKVTAGMAGMKSVRLETPSATSDFPLWICGYKLEKGNKATDWTPSPEDIQSEIESVEEAAAAANQVISDISNDNKLTPSEKQLLKKEYDQINAEKPQLVIQAGTYGVSTTNYVNAYNSLVIYTNPLLVNLNSTSDIVGTVLRSTFAAYYTGKVNLLKAITDKIDDNFGDVYDEIGHMRTELEGEIEDVQNSVDDLDGYVNGAFSDGMISRAEAVAIQKYINQINSEKTDLQGQYNIIYNNAKLSGTPKTELLAAWNTYNTAHTNLINSINTAIADGMTTAAEKADVDAKFSSYRTALTNLTQKFQNALAAIETQTINDIQIGGTNLFKDSKFTRGINSLATANASAALQTGDGDGKSFPLGDKGLYISVSSGDGYSYISQLISVEANTQYTLSFWQNASGGIGTNSSYFRINGSTHVSMLFSITNSKTYTKKTLTFTTPADATTVQLRFGFQATQFGWMTISGIKLERGNKATDWTPAPEDVDAATQAASAAAANALAQAQNAQNTAAAAASVTDFLTKTTIQKNIVATGTLLVGDANGANAMICGVTDQSNGESIRFAAGKDYANKYLSPFQVLDNGMVRFVNPLTGQKTFELGFNQNTGKVVFDIYNDSGIKVASIGSQGIMFTGYVPESYTKRTFRKLTTTSFTAAAIQTEIVASIMLKRLYATYPPTGPATDTTQYFYDIGLNINTTAYEYYEGRNFESAGNAQYAGFYTTANKLGDKLPDGIYLKQQILTGWTQRSTGTYTMIYQTTAYLFQNGRIISSLEVSKTLTISSIPNKSTNWDPEDYEQ